MRLQALLPSNGPSRPQDRYTRLDTEMERANEHYVDDTLQQQQVWSVGGCVVGVCLCVVCVYVV